MQYPHRSHRPNQNSHKKWQQSEEGEVTETFEDAETEDIEEVVEAKIIAKTTKIPIVRIQEAKGMNRTHLGTRVGLIGFLQILLGNVSHPPPVH